MIFIDYFSFDLRLLNGQQVVGSQCAFLQG